MWDFIHSITNPEQILHIGGLALVLIILFAENGIIIGFFLPGDSLLFFTGLITSTQPQLLDTPIVNLLLYMSIASLCGCLFGYYFGWRLGPAIFNRKDSFFFKKKYVDVTRTFYERHGGKTLILGKFLPYIRTFAPILAGVIHVPFKSFLGFNVVGAIAWVCSLTLIETLSYFTVYGDMSISLPRLFILIPLAVRSFEKMNPQGISPQAASPLPPSPSRA